MVCRLNLNVIAKISWNDSKAGTNYLASTTDSGQDPAMYTTSTRDEESGKWNIHELVDHFKDNTSYPLDYGGCKHPALGPEVPR